MDNQLIKSHKDLVVWQRSLELVIAIYELTGLFPKSEMYGLTIQMRLASISIASNIAEGKRRGSRKDFRHFLLNSFGSGAEVETQIEIAKRLSFGKKLDYEQVDGLLNEVMRILNRLIFKLQPTT